MTIYLPRSAWTSVPAGGGAMPPRPVGIAVHWPGSTTVIGSRTQADMAARLEGYRRFHVYGRGWSDIAYQVGIDQNGRVWDLRGIDRESAANGDQSVNLTYLACLFLLGPGETPGPALLQAFADWRRDKALVKYPTATRVVGHQDIRPTGGTDCPGPITEALIKAGRLTASAAPQEDDMPYSEDQIRELAAEGVLSAKLGRSDITVAVALQRIYGVVSDTSGLAAQLAAALPKDGVTVTDAQLEGALRKVLGSVDEVQG